MADFSFKDKLFGKEVEIILDEIDQLNGESISKLAYGKGLKLQKIFNVFDEKSELSKLNTKLSQKKEMVVSPQLLEVITKAKDFSSLTNGEYDVSLGKLFLARKKSQEEPKLSCSHKNILIKKSLISSDNSDVLIDLGSIAKGYIADKMVEVLKNEGILAGYVDTRGDIMVFGEKTFQVGIAHPRKKDAIILEVNLTDCGVATSGDYNQYYGSYTKSHILKSKELISVTVVAPTLMEADGFASAIFVTNKKVREKILSDNNKIKAFTIDNQMNVAYYNGFEKLIVKKESVDNKNNVADAEINSNRIKF